MRNTTSLILSIVICFLTSSFVIPDVEANSHMWRMQQQAATAARQAAARQAAAHKQRTAKLHKQKLLQNRKISSKKQKELQKQKNKRQKVARERSQKLKRLLNKRNRDKKSKKAQKKFTRTALLNKQKLSLNSSKGGNGRNYGNAGNGKERPIKGLNSASKDLTKNIKSVKDKLDRLRKSKNSPANDNSRLVIGKVRTLKSNETKKIYSTLRDTKLKQKEYTLLKKLPDKGNARDNWKQNSAVLRTEMKKGKPIRDGSVDKKTGKRLDSSEKGFLHAERNLLDSKGWKYNKKTTLWYPPKK